MDEMKKKQEKMLNCPVEKLVLTLAWPAILSMLVTAFYNMADTFFVSKISTSASGAVGVVFSLMSIIQACGFFFGHGSGNFISKKLGNSERESAAQMASTGFFLAFGFGILITVFGLIFQKPLAYFLGSTDTILPHAVSYMRYILVGAPFMCASFLMNNQLRFQGETFFAMIGMVSGAILNIGLDPLLIFTFKMGTGGAALATLISQFVSFLLLFIGCNRKGCLGIRFSRIRISGSNLLEILRGGFPSLCRQGFAAVSVICLNKACRIVGDAVLVDAAIAAMGIVSKISGFIFSMVIGVGQGFQPVCGFNFGAGRYYRVKKAFWFCVKLSTAFLVVASLAGVLFSSSLVTLFRDDENVIRFGCQALRYQCYLFPLVGFTTMANMMLQNIGKVFRASFLAISRQGLFFIPLVLVLPHIGGLGIAGVMLSQPISDAFSFLSACALHLPFLKNLGKDGVK